MRIFHTCKFFCIFNAENHRLLRIHPSAQHAVQVGLEDVEAGIDHGAVSMPVQFIEIGLPMAGEFHQAGEVLVLVVASV